MPIHDKIVGRQEDQRTTERHLRHGDFHLRYKITVDPPVGSDREWERPEILVEISGADSPLVLENGAELLRAFEHVALEMLRLAPNEHEKVSFDCQNFRSARLQELRLAADVAAERVRKTGLPYAFAPMSSRERRIVHLALRDFDDLRTDSDGEALQRHVVVYPKDYQGKPPAPPVSRRR